MRMNNTAERGKTISEQEYDITVKEENGSLTLTEIVRMMEYLKATGLTAEQICGCIRYMATGIGLPVRN